ncbi:MAG: cell division protein FtsZ [Rubrivivax sp.]
MGTLLDSTGLSLTQALAALALLLVLGLAATGWWRVRQLRARRTASPAIRRAEPGQGGRIDPALDAPLDSGTAGVDGSGLALPDPPTLRLPVRRMPRLDALIDAIATLPIESPVSAEAVWPHLPTSRRAGSKPLLVEGLDAETGQWEPLEQLEPGRKVAELQAGVQLVNRSGALNEIEYSEFVQKAQTLADALGTVAEAPDMIEVVARARELDSLTTPLDAQLTVTLASTGVPWSLGYVHQSAARAGLVPGALPGRWVRPAREDGAPPIVVLTVDTQSALAEADAPAGGATPQVAVRTCQLVLDVPQSPSSGIGVAGSDGDEPFPVWHHTALVLAQALPAVLVDDQGQSISPADFAAIGDEVAALYARLEALELAAGSAAARRLFS